MIESKPEHEVLLQVRRSPLGDEDVYMIIETSGPCEMSLDRAQVLHDELAMMLSLARAMKRIPPWWRR